LLEKRGLPYVRRSTLSEPLAPAVQVVLGDSMGEMFAYYAACDLAFIGGSLLPLGGQNLIEACAMGKPVLIGPHTWNFDAVANSALEAGAALRVGDAGELGRRVRELLQDPQSLAAMAAQASQFSSRHSGASQRVMAVIEATLAA
jgi:3-deoxy-D-manno-octulosonic-acid transferase